MRLYSRVAEKMFKSRKQNKVPPIAERLLLMPAHKLSALIKDGSLTSSKLCEIYADRIKQVHPLVNAMTQDRFKEALDEASRIDDLLASLRSGKPESEFSSEQLEMLHSPLLGVPISVKETIMIKGMKNTGGLWTRRDVNATCDAEVVKNARRWGMVPICTTNVPECTLYWADCQNKVYGRSANPYDLNRISGASSGGEGSLIGAGGSVIGIGSDIGGSLRIPAHYCGIYAHKPSPFLVSPEGNFPDIKQQRLRLFTFGPMTRYASDLRPLLKCLMSDKDNTKQDTYYKFQPEDISAIRKKVLHQLEESADLSQVKFHYFKFNGTSSNGKQSVQVNPEFMEAQQEIIDHFTSKFNSTAECIDLDKYFSKTLITWQCMLRGGGTVDRETSYEENELKNTFGIDSILLEALKMPFGLSKHTKESLLTLIVGSAIPENREKAFALCERFEKLASELKSDFETTMGENGVLIMPTLPTLAYKFNVSLMKTPDLKFPSLFNILQVPVTHATMRLDKKHKLPFGFSIASRPYNDQLTLSIAEEIELTFGGWTEPTTAKSSMSLADESSKADEKQTVMTELRSSDNGHHQQSVPSSNIVAS